MFITKEELENLYKEGRKTDDEIGSMFGVTGNAVMYWRRKYKIKAWTQMDKIRKNAKEKGLRDIGKTTKEEFLALYQKEGKIKLSRVFGCSKQVIRNKIREWGITPLSKTDRINISCPAELTEEQKDVLYGSLLGDGNVTQSGINSRFKETHCLDQKEYLEWKHKVLYPYSKKITQNVTEMPSGYLSRCFTFNTCFHSSFNEFRTSFYTSQGKRLPDDFEKRINGRILAIWYMDDGSLDGFFKKGYVTISSSFKKEEVDRVVNRFNEMGLDASANFYKNNFKGIYILRIHNTDEFFKLTGDHIVPCMKYKIPQRLGGVEKTSVDPQSIEQWFAHLRKFGFINPVINSKRLEMEITGLKNSNTVVNDTDILTESSSGGLLCKSVFDNFYLAHQKGAYSPVSVFSSDEKLKKSLEVCLKYNGKITESLIRTNICNQGGVNNFKPVLAKYIYNEFCKENGRVLDPCSGWGGRLCGFMASKVKSYTGVDVEPDSVKNLKTLYDKMLPFFPEKSFENHCCDFTEFSTDKKFDLVFTSPPYFDTEYYGPSTDQSSFKFHTYEKWRTGFLQALIDKSWNLLETGGRIILNVPSKSKYPIYEDVKSFMAVEREMKIKMKGRYGKGEKFEWLLISEKKN